jgi:hypothetical protein
MGAGCSLGRGDGSVARVDLLIADLPAGQYVELVTSGTGLVAVAAGSNRRGAGITTEPRGVSPFTVAFQGPPVITIGG